jgi:methyl-accepting chemotaxis protein
MNSIKTKLILLIVGALFIVSVTFGIVSYTQAKKILLDETDRNFVQLNQEVSRVVQAKLENYISIVETLAERRIIDDNTPWAEKVAFFQKEAERTGFESFGLIDISGNAFRFDSQRSESVLADRDYFKKAIAGISNYSDVFISRVTGQPSVAVAAPIKRNGRITGVLYGIRDGNELSNYVKDVKIGQTGYAYIVNKEGTVIGHGNSKLVLEQYNPIKASAQDKSVEPLAEFLKDGIAKGSALGQYFFNKRDIYASLQRIEGTDNWSVALAMELDEILAGTVYLRNIIMGITIGLLFLGGILAYFIGAGIARPVVLGVTHAEEMARLDLSKDVPSEFLNRKDELGTLGNSLQTLTNILRETVVEIIKSSQQVATATQQIGQDNENLSQRTSEQASSLEEIAATIEESNATTKQNSDNATEASKLANNTLSLAQNGGEIVEEAVKSIGEINASSARIADIISMINEIAFQTNLLALNAAVEAARAGDQGRGFAVVAGEVRNLAQRSGEAAKEIGVLIKDSVDKIGNGTELVNKSGEALSEIIEAVKQVNNLVSEMAAASDEQRRGIEQINTAITEMDTMTQQNAALVEETASASEEMSGQAQELLSMVQKFNVGDAAAGIIEYENRGPAKRSVLKIDSGNGKGTAGRTVPLNDATKKSLMEDGGYEEF